MGRKITLDGFWEHELAVKARRVESTIGAGFRVGWLTGKDDEIDLSFDLSCGAGVGSPWLVMEVTMPDGAVLQEVVDMRPLAEAWLEKIVADGPTPTHWWTAQFPEGTVVEFQQDDDWVAGTVTLSDGSGLWVDDANGEMVGLGEEMLNRGRVRRPVMAG